MDFEEISKCLAAVPANINRTITCGIQAHLLAISVKRFETRWFRQAKTMPLVCLKHSHSKDCDKPADERSDDDPNNDTHAPSTDGGQNLSGDDAGDDTVSDCDYEVEEGYQLRRPVTHEITRHNLYYEPNCQLTTYFGEFLNLIYKSGVLGMREDSKNKGTPAYHRSVATLGSPYTHVGCTCRA